jgi:hypothetical protein
MLGIVEDGLEIGLGVRVHSSVRPDAFPYE